MGGREAPAPGSWYAARPEHAFSRSPSPSFFPSRTTPRKRGSGGGGGMRTNLTKPHPAFSSWTLPPLFTPLAFLSRHPPPPLPPTGPGQQLGNTVTYMRDLALEQDDDGVAERGSPRRGDLGRAAQAHQRKQLEARQEQQRLHAEDALLAAEEAWQAEKARIVAKTAAASSKASSSIHMKRSSGGRVAPRRKVLDTEVTRRNSGAMPEPNRPWFGGKGGSGGSS